MKANKTKQNRLNNWISRSLKLCTAVYLSLIAIGIILIGMTGAKETEPVVPVDQLLQGILNLNPTSIITLGIFTLLLTPVIQVVIAAVTFSIDRDKLYLGISITLMCILILSLVLTLILI